MTAHDAIIELKQRIGQSIIGQEQVVERLLLTLLCNGTSIFSIGIAFALPLRRYPVKMMKNPS